ncbi:MAG: DM13 domain-containing protein [Pseudomonadota bacterium]
MTRTLSYISAAFLAFSLLVFSSAASLADGPGRTGSFVGASNHIAKGEVTLVETETGWEIHLSESFWFDGAPDPRVGFGKNGRFADRTDFKPLGKNAGAQVYQVPADIDPAEFSEIFIWCRRFSVPLGYATLS